jgi:hypothetical protein
LREIFFISMNVFTCRGLDEERTAIVTSGLRKVAIICKESAFSCAILAGTGVIAKIFEGFKDILQSQNLQYQGIKYDFNSTVANINYSIFFVRFKS